MGIYGKYFLPKIINLACSRTQFMEQRRLIVPAAKGNVLEIGIGSGLNLPFYNLNNVKHITAIEPSEELIKLTERYSNYLDIGIKLMKNNSDNIELESSSVDSIVITFTMCSIRNIINSFEEMRRVLKPEGKLIFCEHGLSPDRYVRKCQNLITPIWKKISGGCHLDRPISSIIENNGFKIDRLDTNYSKGWKPLSYIYKGTAKLN
ncbi:MAG TPA: class I SAM-dependent methyltransferase [Victivallales bacterium]|nr:class I SAM-dependent methyltransferase [Victivallales bacterium]